MSSLSWSNTRITVLEYCQKKYFFSYYGYALKSIDEHLGQLGSTLRQLKSLDMRMGEMTHKILSLYLHMLKKHGEVDIDRLKQDIKKDMEQIFSLSEKRDYSIYNKDLHFGLSEHFYEENTEGKLEETIQKVWKNLDAFIASQRHQKVKNWFTTAHHIYIESPGKPNFALMKVDVEKIPGLEHISVMAAPDFGAMFGEKGYLILDWKSGKEDIQTSGITDQLKVYGLKVLLKQGTQDIGDRTIHMDEIYLPGMHSKGGTLTQEDINNIIEKIIQDIEYQKQFIVDQDPIQNIPLSHQAFKRTSSEKKCISCTFRKVCTLLKDFE